MDAWLRYQVSCPTVTGGVMLASVSGFSVKVENESVAHRTAKILRIRTVPV
jgi:hypothetical protein